MQRQEGKFTGTLVRSMFFTTYNKHLESLLFINDVVFFGPDSINANIYSISLYFNEIK